MSEGGFHNVSTEGSAGRPACPNCGDARSGRFCAVCGQNDRNYVRGMWSVAWDLCRESFEVDSRLFQTLKLLLFRPGRLTTEFSRNRRARYMSPVRLYLFASFLFVLVLSLAMPESVWESGLVSAGDDGGGGEVEWLGRQVPTASEVMALKAAVRPGQAHKVDDILGRQDGTPAKSALMVLARLADREEAASTGPVPAGLAPIVDLEPPFTEAALPDDPDTAGPLGDAGPDDPPSAAPAPEDPPRPNLFVRMFLTSMVDLLHDPDVFMQRVIGNMPIAMFFLLPFLALALALCYFRKKRFFVEHLVFGMHNQTFTFLFLAAALLTPAGSVGRWFQLFFVIIPQVYCLVALRRYYGDGWIRTLFKGFAVWSLYSSILLPGFLLVLFLTA